MSAFETINKYIEQIAEAGLINKPTDIKHDSRIIELLPALLEEHKSALEQINIMDKEKTWF